MQLRFATQLSSAEYVSGRGWEKATLDRCPAHPEGGCSFAKHSPYERMTPPGTLVARWYCREAHQTFSLLPDCLSARLPGPLVEVEAAVAAYEAAPTWEAAAIQVRPDIEVQGALRWLRRRVDATYAAFRSLIGLHPDLFVGRMPTLVLGVPYVLVALRGIAKRSLRQLPRPLGFGPRPAKRRRRSRALQQDSGADPPDGLR